MKRAKRILSLFVILCIAGGLFTAPVYAENCCTLGIDSIVQEDGKIKINFTTNSAEDDRGVIINVEYLYTVDGESYSRTVKWQDITVPSGEKSQSIEFDSSDFMTGEKYRVTVRWQQYCSEWNCLHSVVKDFACTDGMPVYDIGKTFSDPITIGKKPAAMKVTAAESGIYKLSVDCDEDWCLDIECNNEIVSFSNLVYIKKNESVYYKVMVGDYAWDTIESCQASFKAEPAEIETESPSTVTPAAGSTVYTLTDVESIAKINIPKSGQYEISAVCEDGGNIKLLNTEGGEVVWCGFNETCRCLLEAGTYYYAVSPSSYPCDDTHTTTIKYCETDAVQFGDEISSQSTEKQYAKLTVDKKSAVWVNNKSGFLRVIAHLAGEETYISEDSQWPTVLDAGVYYISYYTNDDSAAAEICGVEIPVIEIGNEIEAYDDGGSHKYVILKAPETAEYEFYLPYGTEIEGEWVSESYKYITMQAGETIYFRYYNSNYSSDAEDMTARKYVPEYNTSVSIGKTELEFENGKKTGIKFTADADDIYIIALKNEYNGDAYFEEINIHTDDKTLFEGRSVNFTDLTVNLAKDETVYIDTFNANCSFIKITKPKISGNTVVDCSNSIGSNERETFIYIPSEAGYYNFAAVKKSGDDNTTYVGVSVNGEELGQIANYSGERVDAMVYASADEPMYICLTKGASQTASVELTFEKVTAEAIENMAEFEIEDASYYSVILPETGVYKISGTALYKDDWREEGEYAYFFTPIIKNYKSISEGSTYKGTSFSYDADEGEAPTYFYGHAGDMILFKEDKEESYSSFEYPIKASIVKAAAEEISLNSTVTSTESCKLYSIRIEKDGEYKFEDFSKTMWDNEYTYYVTGYTEFCDGEYWSDMSSYDSSVKESILELKAGTYYIIAATYDDNPEDEHIPEAKFRISKANTLEISGTANAAGVAYEITGSIPENTTLYAALYDGGVLKEVKAVKNPASDGTVSFDNAIGECDVELFVWDNNLKPLCSSVICD